MTDTLRDRIAEEISSRFTDEAVDHTPEVCLMAADGILALPGIAVVELPEPDKGRDGTWIDSRVTVYSTDAPSVRLSPSKYDAFILPTGKARDLAAALLAAADFAERDQ